MTAKQNPTFKEFYDSVKKGDPKFKSIDGYQEIIKSEEFRGIGLTQELQEAEDEINQTPNWREEVEEIVNLILNL